MKLKIEFVDGDLSGTHPLTPRYATIGSAGMDLCAAIKWPIVLEPGKRELIHAGFKIEIPYGYEAQIRPRSGLALKHGVTVLNSPGTIDSDYRGEVGVVLINHGEQPFTIEPGARIAQMVIARVEMTELVLGEVGESERGDGGFGSTGFEVRTGQDQKIIDVFYSPETIEKFEKAGFDGNKAGETLRAILLKLQDHETNVRLVSIGVSVNDPQGHMYSLEKILKSIDRAFVSYGRDLDKAGWIEKVFGKCLAPQVLAMMKVL